MAEQEHEELINYFFQTDSTLLKDLECHRNNDSHRLQRRLDAILKNSKNKIEVDKWTDIQVQSFIEIVVKSYIDAADSIKLSRTIEKFWKPFESCYGDFIHQCLVQNVTHLILKSEWSNSLLIAKVSVLFEQNKQVQTIFRDYFDQVTSLLSHQLSVLLKLSPFTLNSEQTNQLHAVVKICLQLFQVCTDEVHTYMWSDSLCQTDTRFYLHNIVEYLVHILKTQGYHTDCIMLCGTAISLMFNCCPDVCMAVRSFQYLLHHILHTETSFSVESLKVKRNSTCYHDVIKRRLSECTNTTMGPVSVLRGIVSCGSMDILFLDFTNNDSISYPFFYGLFEYTSCLCDGDLTVHYHAFLILHVWYLRLDKSSSLESSFITTKLTSILESSKLTSILESSWNLVMLNWDSPVEDVPETVVDIFTSMMSAWARIKECLPDFPDKILKNLLSTSWYVKGKYRVLASLLKYVDTNSVYDDSGELQHQLLHCLTTNHFASSATNVYKAFLQKLQGKDTAIVDWKLSWLPTLMEGLVSNDSLLRYNTSLHWIPVTFRHLPAAASVLQDHLMSAMEQPSTPEHSTRLLHGWIIVVKSIRMFTGVSDLEHVNVRVALYHADEDVRSDALALVCTTLKKAECISSTEVQLLKEFLPHNIKIDSAPFRQHLGSDVRKLLVRLRDSSLTLLKSPSSNKEKLDCALEFVDWLHSLCMSCLQPGASYQRRKASLDLLHILYESLIYCPDSKQRKGFVPESARKVVDYANQGGIWKFFSADSFQSLVICLLDGADEIQTSAYNLLSRYYDLRMLHDLQSHDRLCCHLLSEALRLCNSPKGHEGQSGAMLCKFVYNKFIIETRLSVRFQMISETSLYDVRVIPEKRDDSAVEFLSSMLSEIRQQLMQAETDLVKASKQYPIHGMISAFIECLCDCDVIWKMSSAQVLLVSENFIELCRDIIGKTLGIMSGVAGQEACPSFAEIGIALENLLLEDQAYSTSTSISPEYQYMLSWCWNNIKECCTSLGEVTHVSIMSGHPLSLSTLHDNSSTFLTVLTKCRHKGVIEGCRSAYIRFCSALFHSCEEEIFSIPSKTLDQMFTNLKYRGISSSVTRRSAGLPIVIQAVLVSEKSMKKNVLLNRALTCLFEICELPLDDDLGLTDLPQVHGLNILNALFSDASLSGSLIGYTSQAVILVIQQFASSSWAIRNAATRYFSSLVTRIFGQKKSSDGMSCNSVTYQELLSYYPELPPFLISILQESSTVDVRDIAHIHPGLFPTLTILSCLKPMEANSGDISRQVKEIFRLCWSFTQSPVYQLRHLVAAALVAMVTVEEVMSCMTSCLTEHVTSLKSSSCLSYNSLHGHLLFIDKMVHRLVRKQDEVYVWNLLLQEDWLLCVNNGIVSSVYINILHKLLDAQNVMWNQNVEEMLSKSINPETQVVGDSVQCGSLVDLLFSVYQRENFCLSSLVNKLLNTNNAEMKKSCLEKLESVLEKSGANLPGGTKLMVVLCKFLCVEFNQRLLCNFLSLISELYLIHSSIDETCLHQLYSWYKSDSLRTLKCSENSQTSVLPVEAILIEAKLLSDEHDVRLFCECLNTFSQSVNENKRLVVVRCLQIVGCYLLSLASCDIQSEWLISLLDACLRLVQDDDTDVRYNTCAFISSLQWEEKPLQFSSFHSNVCYQLFLRYLSDNFTTSDECLRFLLIQLSVPSLRTLFTTRVSLQYQQLFDQEDNSFFAEKIYNVFDIHSCLRRMLKQHQGIETCSHFRKNVEKLSDHLLEDLKYLTSVLDTIGADSTVNICSDNTILGNICSFLLFCDIVTMTTGDVIARQYLLEVIQRQEMLPTVRRKVLSAIST